MFRNIKIGDIQICITQDNEVSPYCFKIFSMAADDISKYSSEDQFCYEFHFKDQNQELSFMKILYADLCKCSEEIQVKKILMDGMKKYHYDLIDNYTKVIVSVV
ncbi:MAG: hypothetical protein Q7U04_15950 [Bacteriovorax sp.]|nr:hypothetical protein [Bacteriovorax sp.]